MNKKEETFPRIVQSRDLKLGDRVAINQSISAFGTATVAAINDGLIHLVRPFVHHGNTVYVGNRILTYVGTENFTVYFNSDAKWILLERDDKIGKEIPTTRESELERVLTVLIKDLGVMGTGVNPFVPDNSEKNLALATARELLGLSKP